MKIALKLSLSFFAFAAAAVLVLAAVTYVRASATIEELTRHHLERNSADKQAVLENWIAGQRSQVRAFAQRPLVRQYSQTVVSTDASDPRHAAALEHLAVDHLGPFMENVGGFRSLVLIDAGDGVTFAATDPDQVGAKNRGLPHFDRSRDGVVMTTGYLPPSPDRPTIAIAATVGGEGMGLAYVRTLVRRLGGQIWCESEVGVGTTFHFSVPETPVSDEHLEGLAACPT